MTTSLTPPQPSPLGSPVAPGAAPGPTGPSGPPRSSARGLSIALIIIGALIIAGGLASAVFTAVRSAAITNDTLTVSGEGITRLEARISAADVTVVYGNTDRVELEVVGNPGVWRLDRDGETVRVHTERGWWLDLVGMGADRATLTLPAEYENRTLDASLRLAAGQITTSGTYGALDLDLSAGSIIAKGSARELGVTINAGRTVLDLDDVQTSELTVNAGEVDGRLTGTAPRAVGVDVSAGTVDLTLPDVEYSVSTQVSVGDFDNRLQTSTSAIPRVSVAVAAGSVTLRAAR